MSLWKWNNVELEIDMEDVDFVKRYEEAFEKMGKEEKEIQKIGRYSEMIYSYCDMFFHLFDNIFGKGTSERLFSGKKHAGIVDECYNSFLNECKKSVDDANKKRNKRLTKYKINSRR